MTRAAAVKPRLVCHVMHSFAMGGLENGVVNLINRMSPERWRHAIFALTEVSESFRARVARDDVVYECLQKGPGHLVALYPRIYALLRRYQPAVVHTRNFAALEAQVPAWAAGTAVRIHGEHGWDVNDVDGQRRRYRLARRLYKPFVHQYVTVSRHLEDYLVRGVGVAARKVEHICNGVDTARFHPAAAGREPIAGCPFTSPEHVLVGTVGRLQAVKDQTNLARAFARAVSSDRDARKRLRLVIAGDGPLRGPVLAALQDAGAAELAWLAGARDDVPAILRGLDLFVLPSLAEGISNTILEAMASGLPVVATRVGGNPELVAEGVTGVLVPPAQSEGLAGAILGYFRDATVARRHGAAARRQAEQHFSLEGMVARYDALYERLLSKRAPLLVPSASV